MEALTPKFFAMRTAEVLRAEFSYSDDMPQSTQTFTGSGKPYDADSD